MSGHATTGQTRPGAAGDWRSWRDAIVVVVPLIVLTGTLWPALHAAWMDRSTYGHGYLIAALALWLAVRAWRERSIAPGMPSVHGVLALAAGLAAAVVGKAADVALAVQLAIPLIVWSAAWTVAGWRLARRLALPAAFMIFAIPVWDAINDMLRDLAIVVVGAVLRQTSVPAFIEGNFIRIPSGTFEVEGGCSGLHYLIVGSALGVFFAVLSFRSWRLRAAFVAAAVVLALVTNWIRILIIVLAGHLTRMQHYLVTVDHYYFGWVLFVVVLAVLFWSARLLYRFDRAPVADDPIDVARAAVRAGDWRIVAAAGLLIAGSVFSVQAGVRPEPAAGPYTAAAPAADGWRVTGSWTGDDVPEYASASASMALSYAGPRGAQLQYFTAWYPAQDQGREVIYYANSPAGSRALILERGRVTAAPGGASRAFAELETEHIDGQRRLVWYAYLIAGRAAASDLAAKGLQAIGALNGRRDAQVTVLSANCAPDCETSRQVIESFVRQGDQIFPEFTLQEETDQ